MTLTSGGNSEHGEELGDGEDRSNADGTVHANLVVELPPVSGRGAEGCVSEHIESWVCNVADSNHEEADVAPHGLGAHHLVVSLSHLTIVGFLGLWLNWIDWLNGLGLNRLDRLDG